ncbi:carboxypeptidase-like regulatory domain-containing protein [Tunturibacter empetritectus]|uniref:Carboxypeptidase-like regulatory domain-containing protein n=1 Tax=Tunturiibacter empetritectus TaxID=3069691 RepID=A0AAU7Z9D2_9BACT
MKLTMVGATCPKSVAGPADTKSHKLLFLVICVLALAIPPALHAQAVGSFSGNVLDKSGSSISGATVKATSQATGLSRDTKTDSAGHYLIPLLPVDTYTVRVDMQGFQSTESRNLKLDVDQARELDFSIATATVVTSVTVSGDAVTAETNNPSLGQVITSQQVSQLPLNGRDFVQLATLTAGATAETNPNSFFTSGTDSEVAARGSFSLSVGGSRPNSTDWLLDGVDNNELTAGGIGVFSSIDDIAEFKVLTYSYSAEYGSRAGPTVLVTTKSGTNNFHGSLFEFVRNTAFDAKGDFDTTTPKFNLNQFGGSIGGPILHNKLFFFVDGEQKYQRQGITFTGVVPSLAMRNGDFSADAFGKPAPTGLGIANPNVFGSSNPYFQCDASGNPITANPDGSQAPGTNCSKIPQNLINSAGQGLLDIYPAPNASGSGYNYVNEPVRILNETKFDVRLDETLTANDNLFGRFSYDQAFSFAPGGAPTLAEANAFGSNENLVNHARNVGIGWSHVFAATTLNQASFGYDRIFNYINSLGNSSCGSALLGIPNADLGCSASGTPLAGGAYSQGVVSVLPTSGYWALGDRGYSPFQGGTNIFSFKDDLDLIRGKHDIHVGIDLRANQMNVGTEAFSSGFLLPGATGNFSGFTCPKDASSACVNAPGDPEADLLMGISGGAIHDQTYDGAVTGRRWKIIRPFVEDDWRIIPSLTLNLGLAWGITTPITEVHNRMANYIPSTGELQIAGQNGVSRSAGINQFGGAYEPRLGLAWKVAGSDKTVLRAGFGIYHDSVWSQGAQGLWQNPPNLGETDQFAGAGCAFATSYCATHGQTPSGTFYLSTGFAVPPTPPTVGNFEGTFYYQPRNFQPGRVRQYNVNVERQLPGDVLLTAGYAGAVGGHILVSGNDLNVSSPSACVGTSSYTLGCLPGGAPYIAPYNLPFNAILLFGDVGKTHYNSLQIKAETKTPKHGLYALIAYTYSKTYDNGLTDGLGSLLSAPYFPLPNWENLDWGLSQINLNHSFTASIIYDLPFGKGKAFGSNMGTVGDTLIGNWQVTLIERISSGFPVPLIDSSNQSGAGFNAGGNGNNYNRPDQIPGCNTHASHSAPNYLWINPKCFAFPAAGELGDANRVPVSGPDFVNTDFSLIKQFRLPREMGLNFRAEFFNLFNHPQYGSPIADINFAAPPQGQVSDSFGKVTSTVNNPRLIQLALKLNF